MVRPVVTFTLIGITTLFYLLQQASTSIYGGDLLFYFGGKINQFIVQGQFWRFLTPALLHASPTHILFNMYALYSLGRELEMAYGHKKFLLLYALGAFAGNVLSFVFTAGSSLGASTAVFGLVAAEGVFIYQNRQLFGSRTRSMLMNTATIIVINLFLGLSVSSIDNFGHLGGLLGGALFAWLGGPKWKVEGFFPDFHIADERENNQVIVGALCVLIIFGAVAVLKLFMS